MKMWTHTLAWIAATLIAVLLALTLPEGMGWFGVEFSWPHGATAPR